LVRDVKDAESNRQVLPISKYFAVARIVRDFGYRCGPEQAAYE